MKRGRSQAEGLFTLTSPEQATQGRNPERLLRVLEQTGHRFVREPLSAADGLPVAVNQPGQPPATARPDCLSVVLEQRGHAERQTIGPRVVGVPASLTPGQDRTCVRSNPEAPIRRAEEGANAG